MGFGIVALVLGKGKVGRQFAAEDQNEPVVKRAGNTAARGWQRRSRAPRPGLGIVHVVQARALNRTFEAPTPNNQGRTWRKTIRPQ